MRQGRQLSWILDALNELQLDLLAAEGDLITSLTPTFLTRVPAIVHGIAFGLLERESEPGSMNYIRRLVTDKRMERVWAELLKIAKGGCYRYPAHPAAKEYWIGTYGEPLPEGTSSQELAVGMFFFKACLCAAVRDAIQFMALTESEFRTAYGWLEKRAARLREDADLLRVRCVRPMILPEITAIPGAEEHALAIDRAAKFLDDQFARAKLRHKNQLKRVRGDRRQRAYVIELGEFSRELFGKALHGTLATTASVALESDVSRQSVREWLRG